MSIYIHEPITYSKGSFSHMVADSIEELHQFAEKIGIKRCWFENKRDRFQPHYDIKAEHYQTCLDNGAVYMGWREMIKFLEQTYSKTKS